jgi:hypothetical protein
MRCDVVSEISSGMRQAWGTVKLLYRLVGLFGVNVFLCVGGLASFFLMNWAAWLLCCPLPVLFSLHLLCLHQLRW